MAIHACIVCDRNAAYHCNGCGHAQYCSKECQVSDWKAHHRKECSDIGQQVSKAVQERAKKRRRKEFEEAPKFEFKPTKGGLFERKKKVEVKKEKRKRPAGLPREDEIKAQTAPLLKELSNMAEVSRAQANEDRDQIVRLLQTQNGNVSLAEAAMARAKRAAEVMLAPETFERISPSQQIMVDLAVKEFGAAFDQIRAAVNAPKLNSNQQTDAMIDAVVDHFITTIERSCEEEERERKLKKASGPTASPAAAKIGDDIVSSIKEPNFLTENVTDEEKDIYIQHGPEVIDNLVTLSDSRNDEAKIQVEKYGKSSLRVIVEKVLQKLLSKAKNVRYYGIRFLVGACIVITTGSAFYITGSYIQNQALKLITEATDDAKRLEGLLVSKKENFKIIQKYLIDISDKIEPLKDEDAIRKGISVDPNSFDSETLIGTWTLIGNAFRKHLQIRNVPVDTITAVFKDFDEALNNKDGPKFREAVTGLRTTIDAIVEFRIGESPVEIKDKISSALVGLYIVQNLLKKEEIDTEEMIKKAQNLLNTINEASKKVEAQFSDTPIYSSIFALLKDMDVPFVEGEAKLGHQASRMILTLLGGENLRQVEISIRDIGKEFQNASAGTYISITRAIATTAINGLLSAFTGIGLLTALSILSSTSTVVFGTLHFIASRIAQRSATKNYDGLWKSIAENMPKYTAFFSDSAQIFQLTIGQIGTWFGSVMALWKIFGILTTVLGTAAAFLVSGLFGITVATAIIFLALLFHKNALAIGWSAAKFVMKHPIIIHAVLVLVLTVIPIAYRMGINIVSNINLLENYVPLPEGEFTAAYQYYKNITENAEKDVVKVLLAAGISMGSKKRSFPIMV